MYRRLLIRGLGATSILHHRGGGGGGGGTHTAQCKSINRRNSNNRENSTTSTSTTTTSTPTSTEAAAAAATAGAAGTTAPAAKQLSLNDALSDLKQAQDAIGGAMRGDEALAIATLLAREVLQEQTTSTGKKKKDVRARLLKSTLVSPPLSQMRSRQRCRRLLEYAVLCENVYDLKDDKDWLVPPRSLHNTGITKWKLLSSHPGGVCIPRHVVLRVDGGLGTKGRRRTKRILVVVRGTAEVTDAAINIAMTPGVWQYGGEDHQCHKGIIESTAFLTRMVRPVIWRAIDELKEEGVDPGDQLEVILTGHSLGAATAAIAALELQGEFGLRVPARSIGFSTPASLSEELATAPLTRKICKTIILGDDIIPRCSTRNLQELKLRAREVVLHQEVDMLKQMVTDEVVRKGDEWTKQLSTMLRSKADEATQQIQTQLPALDKIVLPTVGDVDGLKQALGGLIASVLPQQQQQQQQQSEGHTPGSTAAAVLASTKGEQENWKKEQDMAQVLDQALAEYQAALDAEIAYVNDWVERIKKEALAPFLPPSPSAGAAATRAPSTSKYERQGEDEEEEDEEDDDDEEALLAANAALAKQKRNKMMDLTALQTILQQALQEKAAFAAAAVKTQAEARVKNLLASIKVKEVKDKAAETVQWMTDSLKGFHSQAKAALPKSGAQKKREAQAAAAAAAEIEAAVVGEGEEEEEEEMWEELDLSEVALYPPGEVLWIHPTYNSSSSSSSSTATTTTTTTTNARTGYELRRVRNVQFFDGVILSPHLFTDHLLTSTIRALNEIEKGGGGEKKR